MSHDLCRSDLLELARALGLVVPPRWTIRALWRQCLERARALNEAERERARVVVSTAPVLMDGAMVRERLAAPATAIASGGVGGAGGGDRDANPDDYCAVCGRCLALVDQGDGSALYKFCTTCEPDVLAGWTAVDQRGSEHDG